jgi:hypothetical protein
MPGQLYNNNCQYTAISTLGTTTVDQGASNADPGLAGRWGVFYGFSVLSTGTAGMVVTAYDLVTSLTGTATTTNTIMVGTATAPGQFLQAGAPGVGVRYKGSLVVVTSGTAGAGLSLWD